MPKSYTKKQGYVLFTEEIREALVAERERTGLAPTRVLARMCSVPKGLNLKMIHTWFENQQQVRKSLYDAVLKAYSAAPDHVEAKPVKPSEVTTRRNAGPHDRLSRPPVKVEITDEMRAQLNAEFERTGIEHLAAVRRLPAHKRQGAALQVSRWRSGKTPKAPLNRWQAFSDFLKGHADQLN